VSEFPHNGVGAADTDHAGTAGPAADPIAAAKQRLRAQLLERRRGLDTAELDAQLLARLPALLTGRRIVAGYAPLRREPGGAALPGQVAELVDRLLLPVLRPDNDLDWADYADPLPTGPGLPEPPRLGVTAVNRVDLMLVPAVAVDPATGVRLGRGGGSYDRVLARLPPGTPVIALLYPGELRADLPADRHDRRVTAVLTTSGLVVPGSVI
jgi:5-formyltetrahydrofolate cyclo-ligase